MDKPTLKRLGAQLRKEIVPLEDLPFTIRAALRQLAEKYDEQLKPPSLDQRDKRRTSSHKCGPNDADQASVCKR